MLLRVVSTSTCGSTAFAASTSARVFVATAEEWSSTLRQTFHAMWHAAAEPSARKNVSPADNRAPVGVDAVTASPRRSMMRAASSVPHSTPSSRVKNEMARGLSPIPSASHVSIDVGHVFCHERVEPCIGYPQQRPLPLSLRQPSPTARQTMCDGRPICFIN